MSAHPIKKLANEGVLLNLYFSSAHFCLFMSIYRCNFCFDCVSDLKIKPIADRSSSTFWVSTGIHVNFVYAVGLS